MGVGGNFWDALKPYARYEGFDFLRNKKVAVDLSFWIVQHESALKSSRVRNPHIRLTFFRTINLFSKFGAFPVFVVDGKPSPLKSQARIVRFFRSSGIDLSNLPVPEEGVSVDRNKFFVKCVQECVELLELLGMPIIRAKGEAEALCAQLNSEGLVDACMTADSDAFLFGAKCVIKRLDPKSKEPFECYHMEDIEAGLGLKRKHLLAVSLLIGSDHNLSGVQGVGRDTALRFVKKFSEDEVLDRLNEIGSGSIPPSNWDFGSPGNCTRDSVEIVQKLKTRHCSLCGHPGSKTGHSRVPCEHCYSTSGVHCCKKPLAFKCECSACNKEREEKEYKKHEDWNLRVCKKIAKECNFLSKEIIEIYLRSEDNDAFGSYLSWKSPEIDILVEFLVYHQHWEPSYIRQRMFPMLSTIFLREKASNMSETLLYGQYEFDSIQRLKVRCGHQFYVVKWRKSASVMNNFNDRLSSKGSSVASQPEEIQSDESASGFDEVEVLQFLSDGGCSFVLTDENLDLVQNAFPKEVDSFLQQKEMKESKRRKSSSSRTGGTCEKSQNPDSGGLQLAITDYYRSSKILNEEKDNQDLAQNIVIGFAKGKSKATSASLPKSVRRRLLFD